MDKPKNIRDALQKWLNDAERVVVVGVGNALRRDDFVGVEVVRGLKDKVSEGVLLVESETVPESFIESIVAFKPTHILLIDAGLLGLKAGDAKFVKPSKFLGPPTATISTHALPLRIFCEYVKKTTGATITLLIVQPKRTDFGEGLSGKVEEAAENLIKILTETLPA